MGFGRQRRPASKSWMPWRRRATVGPGVRLSFEQRLPTEREPPNRDRAKPPTAPDAIVLVLVESLR